MKGAASAMVSGENLTTFLIKQLLAGNLVVRVKIGDQMYDGHVCQMDFAKDLSYAFCTVRISGLPPKNPEDDGADFVKVTIHVDGSVDIIPDDLQDD